jgi:serine/threonine-protein kinase
MSDQTHIDSLVVRYEELRAGGTPVSAEELCRDCPELLTELRRQLQVLGSMDALLGTATSVVPVGFQRLPDDASAGPAQTMPGEAVAATTRYRVLRLHASGGLGEVLVAHDEELHRDVALKRLQAPQTHNPNSRRRFLREAEITSRLEHPGIVPIHAVGQERPGHDFYTMRFVQGETLHEAIQRWHAAGRSTHDPGERRLEFRQLVSRLVAVCHTVAYAHSRAVLHRDIKPNNILLGPYGETLLVDWGLAKVLSGATSEPGPLTSTEPAREDNGADTQAGTVLGTPAYMSPEQAAGQWDLLGPASDLYSLGATLYVLLTGQPAFDAGPVGAVLDRVRRGDFPPPRQRRKDVPHALEAICLKAMARQPEDRYATAEDLAADLEHWLADAPVSAWREPWRLRARRWLRQHQRLATGAVVLLVTALAALAVSNLLLRHEQRQTAAQKGIAEQQRDRADNNLALAKKAVEDYLTRVADDDELKKADLHQLRKQLLATAVPFLARFARQEGSDPSAQAEQGKALYLLGRLRAEMGETAAAIADYQAMQAIFARLVSTHPDVPAYRQELVHSYNNLAILNASLGRMPAAETSYREALRLQQRLTQDYPEVADYQQKLALTHNNLAILYQDTSRLPQAEQAYRRARDIQEGLVRRYPKVARYRRDLAATLHDQATLYRQTGGTKEAESTYHQARERQERLVQEHPEAVYRQELARTCRGLANLYQQTQRPAQAETYYRQAQDLLEELTRKYPSLPVYLQELGQCKHALGSLSYARGRLKDAVLSSQQARAIRQRLVWSYPAVVVYQQELALSHHNLGAYYKAAGKAREAEAFFRLALETQERLAREQPTATGYQRDLALSRCSLGDLLRDTGRLEAALESFTQAIHGLEPVLNREATNPTVRKDLSEAHWRRADALVRGQRYADALTDWERALRLATGANRDLVRLRRAATLVHLGDLSQALRETEELASRTPASDAVLLQAACVFALVSGAVGQDKQLSQGERTERADVYARRSLQLLEKARGNGYFKTAAHLKQLTNTLELASLRSRPEFKKFTSALQDQIEAGK